MYKTKLQELCQRRSWSLPEYEIQKEGPPHNPRFSSTVIVNSIPFVSSSPSRTAKLAQNSVAMVAFNHFSQPTNPNPIILPLPLPVPSITDLSSFPQPALWSDGSPGHSPGVDSILPTLRVLQPNSEATSQTSQISSIPTTCSPGHRPGVDNIVPTNTVLQPNLAAASQSSQISSPVTTVTDITKAQDQKCMLHAYKNQLQHYAQKRNLNLPAYSPEWEGPPHALRFKCKVTVDGQTFESPKFYSTLKDAEHAAAEFALVSLLRSGVQEENTVIMYKNLLQELLQKEGFRLPVYGTIKSGEAHIPIFVSQVEVEGELFTGQEAKSRKQAETSAAKVAYTALKERKGLQLHSHKNSPVSPGLVTGNQPNKDKDESDQTSLLPLSAHQGQTRYFASDHLESSVVTDLQHNSDPKSLISLGLDACNQPNKDKGEKGSSSFGNTNGGSKDSSLSNDKRFSPFSYSNNVGPETSDVSSTAESTPSRKKKIIGYSRKTNVPIEANGTILPISDDKWVAYSYSQ